jgi:hypothetical protein
VSLANSIHPESIPAEVRLRVESEDFGTEGIDYFGQGLSEQLFDTPQAVARIWRSKTGRRRMIVSAGDSRDANGRPLRFEWRLLQGDPDKVGVEPLGDGSRARITLDWHDPFEISEDLPVTTSRVDIGVFANNGVHDSAPAILSWYFPPREKRRYETGPDGATRIVEIDHSDPERQKRYADPLLMPDADWRDRFEYDAEGRFTGWMRARPGRTERFTATGTRIVPGTDGAQTEAVIHVLVETADGTYRIREIPARVDASNRGAPTLSLESGGG